MKRLLTPAESIVVALTIVVFALASEARAAEAEVSGTFAGDGKVARLAHASSLKGTELADKPTVILVFTEKDHSKEKRPDIMASFGKFGSALIITIYPGDGKIVGCEVAHEAHEKKPFSSLGSIETTNFKNEDGQLSGKIATTAPVETFGQKWEVSLTFRVKAP